MHGSLHDMKLQPARAILLPHDSAMFISTYSAVVGNAMTLWVMFLCTLNWYHYRRARLWKTRKERDLKKNNASNNDLDSDDHYDDEDDDYNEPRC